MLRRRRDVPRRHLRPGVSVDTFFDELNRLGIRYAVLRWFETLPAVEPGEDIDILVADEDVARLRPMLRSYLVAPASQKFDVYTVHGLPGSDFKGVPYFTPSLAAGLLDRATLRNGRYRVPCAQDHFDSLAYHAVYHKGHSSGLVENAASDPMTTARGEHDYAEVLARLATECSLSVSMTLEGLDGYLAERGLRPPVDTLDKLSTSNSWLRGHMEKLFGPADGGMPGLAVFVLRERAQHLLGRLCTELSREGLEPLETVHLSAEAVERVRSRVRGGNWGKGPWAVSGGGPAVFVVAYDMRMSVVVGGTEPSPERVTDAKLAIRQRLLDAEESEEGQYNPLHSSDDPRQALDYLELLHDPDIVGRLQHRITAVREQMAFPYPVVEVLPSLQRRAVTAVVAHPEFGECVCKLFYPSTLRYLHREIRARTEFSDLPEIPALLESGHNYLLTPRYVDAGNHIRRSLSGTRHMQLRPEAAAAMARLAHELHRRGAYLLDLSTQNLITDPAEGLKVIDWEFLQDFTGDKPPLTSSPTVRGTVVGEPAADMPSGVSMASGPVATVFRPLYTGVPVPLLMHATRLSTAIVAEPGMMVLSATRAVYRGGRRYLLSARWGIKGVAKRILALLETTSNG